MAWRGDDPTVHARGLSTPACQRASKCQSRNPPAEDDMLWTIFAILLLLWLLGWGFHVAGSLIHLLLVVAVVVMAIQLITGRRAVV